jgi:hypothetical protein
MINILLFILVILLLMSREEKYSVASKESGVIALNDPLPNMVEYVPTKTIVNHDIMESLVLTTSKYIKEKTGINNYIIETSGLKQFVHKHKNHGMYRCMFMVLKRGGFPYGFMVSVDILVTNASSIGKAGKPNVRVISARSQPMNVKPPANRTPFESSIEGHEYIPFDEISKSEEELLKLSPGNINDKRRGDLANNQQQESYEERNVRGVV